VFFAARFRYEVKHPRPEGRSLSLKIMPRMKSATVGRSTHGPGKLTMDSSIAQPLSRQAVCLMLLSCPSMRPSVVRLLPRRERRGFRRGLPVNPMQASRCGCSAHDPDGEIERATQALMRANRAKLWALLGPDASIAHRADQTTLERLTRNSGMA
jgi:hypothetical protein